MAIYDFKLEVLTYKLQYLEVPEQFWRASDAWTSLNPSHAEYIKMPRQLLISSQ